MSLILKFKHFLIKRKWERFGKPRIFYPGYNCGCCGKWVKEVFEVPTYLSIDEWADTWGLCFSCENDDDSEGQRMIDREIAFY